VQGIVKPREIVSVFGKCHIKLSQEERTIIDTQKLEEDVVDDEPQVAPIVAKAAPISTHVEDSDDEAPPAVKSEPVKEPEPEPDVEPEQKEEVAKPVVKKVIKKAAALAVPAQVDEVPASEEPKPVVKKVVKKKV
jgi:hypothetical protein